MQKKITEISLEINQQNQMKNITFENFIHDDKILEMCRGKNSIEEINIKHSLYNDMSFMNSLHELIRKVSKFSDKYHAIQRPN